MESRGQASEDPIVLCHIHTSRYLQFEKVEGIGWDLEKMQPSELKSMMYRKRTLLVLQDRSV